MESRPHRAPRPGARRAAALAVAVLAPLAAGTAAAPAAAAGVEYDVTVLAGWGDAAGVAVGEDGTAYVVDSGDASVYSVDADETVVDIGVSDLAEPGGIALRGSTLYVADTGNHRVVSVGTDGGEPRRLAGRADATPGAPVPGRATDSPLRSPGGVAVDAQGDLLVADTGNNQVEQISLGGGTPVLSVVAGTGTAAAQVPGPATSSPLDAPADVAAGPSGDVLVADTGNRAVARVSGGTLATAGVGAAPGAVAVTSGGTVLTARGADVVVLGSRTPLATAEGDVQGLAVADDGAVWVAAGSEVLVLRPVEDDLRAPRITSSPPARAAKGQALTATFGATGVPAPRWSLLSAPSGFSPRLAIDPATGVLTGTPGTSAGGSVTFTVRAENTQGHDDQVVTLALGAAPGAPTAVTAVPGAGRAVVSWKAPSGTATEAVTGWVVTPTAGTTAGQPVQVGGAGTSTTVTGLAAGTGYTFTVAATNAYGTGAASTASAAVQPWASPAQPAPGLTRLEGAGRIQTAVRTSQQLFPTAGSARAVVLTSSTSYADALAGARLASAEGAPLLLTDGVALSPTVAAEVRRVLAVPSGTTATRSGSSGSSKAAVPSVTGTVFLLGGTGALSADVETAVKALSASYTVVRLAGADRFATAVAIAAQVAVDAPVDDAPVYVASGTNFPDGLAVAALAARTGGVVLLSDGARMPAATSAYLAVRDPAGDRVVPVGGPAAAAVGARGASRAVVGADRYETARLVAGRLVAVSGLSSGTPPVRTVGLATGENWPDALAGAAAMGNLGGPLLLTPSAALSPAARDAVGYVWTRGTPTSGVVFGGTAVVSPNASIAFGSLLSG